MRIVSRRNSPRKSKRPRKATSRATGVATATLLSPTQRADPTWPIGATSADIDRPIGMMRAHPLEHDAHGMRDLRTDARYEIRIRGILGRTVAGAFPGLLARENHRRDGAHRPAPGPGRTLRSPCSDRSARTRAHRNPASVASDGSTSMASRYPRAAASPTRAATVASFIVPILTRSRSDVSRRGRGAPSPRTSQTAEWKTSPVTRCRKLSVCAASTRCPSTNTVEVVEMRGLEPLTPAMRTRCSSG